MPVYNTRPQRYTPQKKLNIKWDGWDGGWNNFYNANEIQPNELSEAVNVMLTGKGTVTGRWGSAQYFLAGSGRIRGLVPYYVPETSVNQLLAMTDSGYLVKKTNASYTMLTGASFSSGYSVQGVEIGNNAYFVGGNRELVKYNGTSLSPYATIAKPTNVLVTNLSGVSGTFTWAWRVSAYTDVGETLATTSVQLVNLPQDLTQTLTRVTWTAPSTASGVLKGYSVYRGQSGDETFIGSVDASTTTFLDYGEAQSETIFPQDADGTGGPKAKCIARLDDRLIVAGFDNDPSLVMISARFPYESRFNWADGGGYIRVSPDDGEKVTALGVVGSNVKGGTTPLTILVFKERSTYAMVLKTVTIGGYVILDPQFQRLLSVGCTNATTVKEVENDVFFLSRDGVYSVGSEPNFLNEIRSREVSTRIRTYIEGLSDSDFDEATAGYINHLYLISFPTRKETIVYDYERRAWMGPWKTNVGITVWEKYFDSDGIEQWVAGTTSSYVNYFSPSLKNDSGTAFKKLAVTRREDFNDWTVMKIVELFNILFRSVKGTVSVTVRGEDRSGSTVALKSFTVSGGSFGSAGYGADQYGVSQYGLSQNDVNVTSEDFIRWTQLYKTIRTLQIEVTSEGASDQWELVNIKAEAIPLGVGSLSPSTRA